MSNITPVSTATQNIFKLQALIDGQSAPSKGLLQILNNCPANVKSSVEMKVTQLGEQFCSSYNNMNDGSRSDFGRKRLLMGQTLFYKLLEMILNDEKRKKPNYDVTVSLQMIPIKRNYTTWHIYICLPFF